MVKSRKLRWLLLGILLLTIILVPFFLFGTRIDTWINSFIESANSHSFITAAIISALLASDILLPVPSSIVATSAGFFLGFPGGFISCWLGMTIACLAGYWLGSKSRKGLSGHLLEEADMKKLENLNLRFGDWFIVIARAVPVLAEASVLFAGIGSMPIKRFILMSALSNAAVSAVYAGVGACSASVNSFLLAFGASILIPACPLLIQRLRTYPKRR